MSGETPPPGPLVPVERAPVHGARVSSLVAVLWGLTGALIGVVLGAAGVGDNLMRYVAGDARQGRELGELSSRLGDLRQDLLARERELSAERQERKEALAALKAKLEAAEWASLAATLKGDFLARFLAYEQAKSETTRRHLADSVCALRSQAKAARMTLVSAPLEVTIEELRRGVPAEFEQLLVQHNVPQDLLARARRPSPIPPMPAVTPFNVLEVQRAAQARRFAMREEHEAIAALQRHVQNIKVARAVRFSDGAEYVLPNDVARLLLARRDCQID